MFFSAFERMMAWRYLRARKAEGFVSVIAGFSFLGIMLGVATLIIVMSVMNGFRAELMGRILGLNGHINITSDYGSMHGYETLVSKIKETPGVTHVFPMVEKQALFSLKGSSTGVMVRGLDPKSLAEKPVLSKGILEGTPEQFAAGGAAIGKELAKRYGLDVGSSFTLISPQGKATPFGTMPRSRTFTVAMIFDVEMYEYNANFVFLPLDEAQVFYVLPNAVNVLEVFTADANTSEDTANAIVKNMPPTIRIIDWRESNGSFFTALQVERNVMFLILTLIILVAAFNIISSMIMLVKDKGRDIAILRTMGASRRNMLKVFILTGASIGIAGTFAGALLGTLFAANIESIRQFLQGLSGTDLFSAEIYFLTKLPAKLDFAEVGVVVLMAFTLSLLATLYPAWRAAKLEPVEALRYE